MTKPTSATIRKLAFLFVLMSMAATAFGSDSDGDGVIDSLDACPATVAGEVVDASGCSVADLCPCSGPTPSTPWPNHGQYVSCVSQSIKVFAEQGLVPNSQRGLTVSAAARSGCGHESAQATEALTIQPFYEDPDHPADEGVLVFIDGTQAGVTGVGGTFTVELTPSLEYQIRALDVGVEGGRAIVLLEPTASGTQTIQIYMKGEQGVTEDAALLVDGVSNRVLESGFAELGLHFEYPSGSIGHLNTFKEVSLVSPRDEDVRTKVTALFHLDSEGRMILDDIEAFRSILLSLPTGEVTIRAYGEDAQELIFQGSARFYVGLHTLGGLLLAPPSKPGLQTGALEVSARFLQDREIVRTTVSDFAGGFSFSSLPAGNWEITATTQDGGLTYHGFATVSVMAAAGVRITLRTGIDIINNVPPFEVTSLVQPQFPECCVAPDRSALQSGYALRESFAEAPGQSASVIVESAEQGMPISDSDTLTIPKGTEKIMLTYNVASIEYPFYVLSQSVYNDVWTLAVATGQGDEIFSHHTPSQLHDLRVPILASRRHHRVALGSTGRFRAQRVGRS